jgi:hypothetical protein
LGAQVLLFGTLLGNFASNITFLDEAQITVWERVEVTFLEEEREADWVPVGADVCDWLTLFSACVGFRTSVFFFELAFDEVRCVPERFTWLK